MPYSKSDLLYALASLTFVAMGVPMAREGRIGWWGVVFFALCGLVFLIMPLILRSNEKASRETVEFDERALKRLVGGRLKDRIEWSELKEIGILTITDGPAEEDVFWMFLCRDEEPISETTCIT
ncbi:MAG: hypothetical protein AAF492_25720 [Verrucomicrobiota bacterium]